MSSSLTEIAPARRQLAGFGFTMAAAALFFAWLQGELNTLAIVLMAIAAAFILAALLAPAPLRPLYRRWMRLAEALGWLNTRIILILVYYLVVTPIGLVLRLLRRSPLAMNERHGSFWARPERHSWGDKHFEKQF